MLILENQWNTPEKQIQIQPQTIHIWAADLSKQSIQLEKFNCLLSQKELERAENYKFSKDKIYFVTARGILRKIISCYLEIKPEEIQFFYNAYGKPYLNTQSQIHSLRFNLSHAGDLALYMFSQECEVGIDVEKIHFIDDFEQIAKKFFSPSEYLKLKSIPSLQRLNAFFKCWTRKEAFIKAIGNGLHYPLHQFEVSLGLDEYPALLYIQGDPLLASKWSLNSLTPSLNYEAAFIFQKCCNKIEFFEF